MIAEVPAALHMVNHIRLDFRNAKELPMFRGRKCQSLLQQRAQRSTEPVMRGDIEACLPAI